MIPPTKICIDYYPGSHGSFLEFVCNKMAGVALDSENPFDDTGAAHNLIYAEAKDRIFISGHWYNGQAIPFKQIVSIRFTEHDTLSLLAIQSLRAGTHTFDLDTLDVNTYHKLNNQYRLGQIDAIKQHYFYKHVYSKYMENRISMLDPELITEQDINSVSVDVEQELLKTYNINLLKLDADHPNCPRYVLREFFEQWGLDQPLNSLENMVYDNTIDVYKFPYISFYDIDAFIHQLKQLASWANLQYNDYDSIRELHKQFMIRQPYAHSKQKCDQIIENIINKSGPVPDKVLLIEEAYINRELNRQGYERRYRY
jgi:hypothetical protein